MPTPTCSTRDRMGACANPAEVTLDGSPYCGECADSLYDDWAAQDAHAAHYGYDAEH